jgi:hypothetical protein
MAAPAKHVIVGTEFCFVAATASVFIAIVDFENVAQFTNLSGSTLPHRDHVSDGGPNAIPAIQRNV